MVAVFDICAFSFVFYASAGKHGNLTVSPSPIQRIVAGSITIVITAFLVGILRTGIWASPDALVIRNPLRTHRIRWDAIERIDPPANYGRMWKAGILVKTKDGATASASLFGKGPFNSNAFASDIVDKLRLDVGKYAGDDVGNGNPKAEN
jgi:hypothetical protein